MATSHRHRPPSRSSLSSRRSSPSRKACSIRSRCALTGFAITADGLTITAQWYGGVPECYGVAAATMTSSTQPFVVSIFEGRVPGSEVCIEIALAKGVVFVLDSPLIRDGSLAVAS